MEYHDVKYSKSVDYMPITHGCMATFLLFYAHIIGLDDLIYLFNPTRSGYGNICTSINNFFLLGFRKKNTC